MKILVAGATGMTGRRIVQECARAGHAVTALVRRPDADVPEGAAGAARLDLQDIDALRTLLAGHNLIVSALGNRDYESPEKVVLAAVDAFVQAMDPAAPRRLIVVAGSGLLQHDATTLRRDLPGQPTALRHVRADHVAAYDRLAARTDLPWTFVCPPRIEDGEADGRYRTARDYFPEGGLPVIRSGNIGHMIAREATQAAFVGARVGIAAEPEARPE